MGIAVAGDVQLPCWAEPYKSLVGLADSRTADRPCSFRKFLEEVHGAGSLLYLNFKDLSDFKKHGEGIKASTSLKRKTDGTLVLPQVAYFAKFELISPGFDQSTVSFLSAASREEQNKKDQWRKMQTAD